MTHFSKFTTLFAISIAASISATGCYAETEDPTEDTADETTANADESTADEALAVNDADADAEADEDATAEDDSALSAWGGRGRYYRGYYGGYRPYGYRHYGYRHYGPPFGRAYGYRFRHGYGGYWRGYRGYYRPHFRNYCGYGGYRSWGRLDCYPHGGFYGGYVW